MKTRANRAVNSGPTDMITSTLATLVKVSASMKAVNITLQHTPEIQKDLDSGIRPQWRLSQRRHGPVSVRSGGSRPWLRSMWRQTGRITSSDSAVKALRQNVTSKRAADSSWRETTPAMDHMRVTASMRKTAWVWVRRFRALKGMVGVAQGTGHPTPRRFRPVVERGTQLSRGWRACGPALSGGACADARTWA
jgi:hypothetical protein